MKVNEVIQGPKILEWLGAYPILKSRLGLSPGLSADNVLANLGVSPKTILSITTPQL